MIGLLLSPLARWLGGAAIILTVIGGIYWKGYSDGKANIQAKWTAAERNAYERGTTAREEAEREIPPIPVPRPDLASPADPGGVCLDRYDRDCH